MAGKQVAVDAIVEVSLGQKIGQLRALPVSLGPGKPRALLLAYCADFDVDPYIRMFFFPTDTLKLALMTVGGEILWRRDLGPGVVPGQWFCPVFAFDLDGDGVDEIWFVNNRDPKHPLDRYQYCLEKVDALSGETAGQWDWPCNGPISTLSHTFRNFLAGGYVNGEPVLITAQGTYEDMYLQGWKPDMSLRWSHAIAGDDPGARGSHIRTITDLDRDGIDEIMWGERCIELDSGTELFCCDRDYYRGHSDVVQPVWDREGERWLIYTCRESDSQASPRVAVFDSQGRRLWGQVDRGHMDMGWVARLGENYRHVAMAIRIGTKTCGPDGRFHQDLNEFVFDAQTGEPYSLPFSVYRTLPVDINGDGYHELVRGIPGSDGLLLDRFGNEIGKVNGPVALAQKITDHPGEQVLTYHADGVVRLWRDLNAEDSALALWRYEEPFYQNPTNAGAVSGL